MAGSKQFICKNCGYCGKPVHQVKGSFFIELILWFFFIIPGIMYTIWRLCNVINKCPSCGQETMISTDSPIGRNLVRELHIGEETETIPEQTTQQPVMDSNTVKEKEWYQTPFWFVVFLGTIILTLFGLMGLFR